MNEISVGRIKTSFRVLAPQMDTLVDRFFTTLFAETPAVRTAYAANMSGHKQKLAETLVSTVVALPRVAPPIALLPRQGSHGRVARLNDEHYRIARDTLLGVMADLAGGAWNCQLERNWRTLIDQSTAATREPEQPRANLTTRPAAANPAT